MNLYNYPLFKFQTIKVWSFELLGKISVNREIDIHANYIGTPGANFLNSVCMVGTYLSNCILNQITISESVECLYLLFFMEVNLMTSVIH